MKTLQSKTLGIALGVAAIGLSTSLAPAATIVDWGGNYVSTTQVGQRGTTSVPTPNNATNSRGNEAGDFDGDSNADDKRRTLIYSESLEMNPTVSANYTGNSAVFYGGGEVLLRNAGATNMNGVVQIQVENGQAGQGASFDTINMSLRSPITTSSTDGFRSGVVFWNLADSLEWFEQVTYGNVTEMFWRTGNLESNGEIVMRYIIEADGQWYQSNTGRVNSNAAATLDATDLDSETWQTIVLGEDDAIANINSFGPSISIPDTAVITKVGVYGRGNDISTDNFAMRVSDVELEADITLIPEPASFALMGLGGLLLLARDRKA